MMMLERVTTVRVCVCVCVCVMCNLKESSGTNTPSCRAFSKVRQNVIQRLP